MFLPVMQCSQGRRLAA